MASITRDMSETKLDKKDVTYHSYLAYLETMVAWGMEDESDEVAEKVLKNTNQEGYGKKDD